MICMLLFLGSTFSFRHTEKGMTLEESPESTIQLWMLLLKISKANRNGGVIYLDFWPMETPSTMESWTWILVISCCGILGILPSNTLMISLQNCAILATSKCDILSRVLLRSSTILKSSSMLSSVFTGDSFYLQFYLLWLFCQVRCFFVSIQERCWHLL